MRIIKLLLLFSIAITTISFGNEKLSNQLKKQLDLNETVDIYVLLKNQNPIQAYKGSDRIGKLKHHIQQLKANADISRTLIQPLLTSLTQDYQFFWVNNSFRAKIASQKVHQLTESNLVIKAFSNKSQKLDNDIKSNLDKTNRAVEWSLTHISVPEVWQQGFKGQGVIIAGQDTGYQWNHAALKNQYAGWDGNNVNQNYHWHDAIISPIIDCKDNA